jgi:hypothetical protein
MKTEVEYSLAIFALINLQLGENEFTGRRLPLAKYWGLICADELGGKIADAIEKVAELQKMNPNVRVSYELKVTP